MQLLRPIKASVVPRDFLLARLRGRRPQPGRPGVDWPALLDEARWLYRRLGPAWRRELVPLLTLLEIRQLGNALRRRRGGDFSGCAAALAGTLLAVELVTPVAGKLTEAQLLAVLGERCGLGPVADLREFETRLTDKLLTTTAVARHDPALQLAVAALIDGRNLLTVQKQLRWDGPEPIPLPGGTLPTRRLAALWRQGDMAKVTALAQRHCGLAPTGGPWLEQLPAALGLRLRRCSPDPLEFALLLTSLCRYLVAAPAAAEGRMAEATP